MPRTKRCQKTKTSSVNASAIPLAGQVQAEVLQKPVNQEPPLTTAANACDIGSGLLAAAAGSGTDSPASSSGTFTAFQQPEVASAEFLAPHTKRMRTTAPVATYISLKCSSATPDEVSTTARTELERKWFTNRAFPEPTPVPPGRPPTRQVAATSLNSISPRRDSAPEAATGTEFKLDNGPDSEPSKLIIAPEVPPVHDDYYHSKLASARQAEFLRDVRNTTKTTERLRLKSHFTEPVLPFKVYKENKTKRPRRQIDEIIHPVTKISYQVIGTLGFGAFAEVFLVCDKAADGGKRQKACKVLDWMTQEEDKEWQTVANEVVTMTSCSHPNIVKLFEHFYDFGPDFPTPTQYFMIEYCDYGGLHRLLWKRKDTLTEPEVRYLGKQVLDAVNWLHNRSLIHRDIKPCNILFSGKPPNPLMVKICDFGISAHFPSYEDQWILGDAGTPNYVAPEVYCRKSPAYMATPVDVWALGCLFYAMVYGCPPFFQTNSHDTCKRACAAEYTFPPLRKQIDGELKFWISRCLQLDPLKRPSVFRLKVCPFFDRSFVPKSLDDIYSNTEKNFKKEEAEYEMKKAQKPSTFSCQPKINTSWDTDINSEVFTRLLL